MLKQLYFSWCNFGGTCNMQFIYTGKVSRAIGKIYTISSFCLNNSSLRTLYYSPVCPYLFYCLSIWASTNPSNLLQKLTSWLLLNNMFLVKRQVHSYGTRSSELFYWPQCRTNSGAHALEARVRGAPWVRKLGKLSIRENLVVTSAYSVRPYTLWGWWKGIGCHSVGGRSMLSIVRCICATRVSLGGKSLKKRRSQVIAFKNLFTSETCFQVF